MTIKILRLLSVFAMILIFSSCSFASDAAQAINNFSFNAAKIMMTNSSGDFFFSPYSIISAFGMAYAGASGKTAAEIEHSLGISSDIHASLGRLIRSLDDSGVLSSANRIWTKDGLKLHTKFTDTLRLYYDSTVKELDFKNNTEASRQEINGWISDRTNGRIQNLLQTLDPATRMILTNAVYFNAEWSKKFNKKRTANEKFYNDGDNFIEVEMMKANSNFMFSEFDGVKIIALPYKSCGLSMIAVLPPKETPDVLKNINSEILGQWIEAMTLYDVDLWLPKFRTENRYELKPVFEALGVNLAFTNSADFSGITDEEPLKIDEVIHQTFIQVDEERTEAAAATAIPMLAGSAMPVKHPKAEFHADRPFMYFIRHDNTGTILFMGLQSFK